MGKSGYKDLLKERKTMKEYLESEMKKVAEEFNLNVLKTKNNPMSIGKHIFIFYFIIYNN